ncbi:MAG: flagellar basal-body rod protein FlgF [Gammaproteobacteria bacterium]|nr:flagellar basal-body rod protein FlgF [Gammaproteobacteria bacterium]
MDKTVYLAMTGAKHTALAQAVNSHNLANINTPGFKADQVDFRSVYINDPNMGSRVYSVVNGIEAKLDSGSINATGNPLDVAVNGEGWFAVQGPDGNEAYTRAGNLRVGAGGLLVNGAGHPVLGDGGPIAVPPASTIAVGEDGTVSIVPVGEDAENIAQLERIKLVNPDPAQLLKGKDGLFRMRDGSVAEADAEVRVSPGSLESANISAVEAMVEMIDLARTYELQVRTMRTAQENDQSDAKLLSLS